MLDIGNYLTNLTNSVIPDLPDGWRIQSTDEFGPGSILAANQCLKLNVVFC